MPSGPGTERWLLGICFLQSTQPSDASPETPENMVSSIEEYKNRVLPHLQLTSYVRNPDAGSWNFAGDAVSDDGAFFDWNYPDVCEGPRRIPARRSQKVGRVPPVEGRGYDRDFDHKPSGKLENELPMNNGFSALLANLGKEVQMKRKVPVIKYEDRDKNAIDITEYMSGPLNPNRKPPKKPKLPKK
jgi:hypothetical protein